MTLPTVPPLHARIPATRHRPRCCSCMSDFPAQRHAVFSSARAMPNGEFHLLLPLDKAWGGQQSCKLKGTASMHCHRGSLWLFRTASCLGACAFKAPAFKCLVLIRRAWVDLADVVSTTARVSLCWSCFPLIMPVCVQRCIMCTVCIVGILVFTTVWVLECVRKGGI
jgi:hypothetical protein